MPTFQAFVGQRMPENAAVVVGSTVSVPVVGLRWKGVVVRIDAEMCKVWVVIPTLTPFPTPFNPSEVNVVLGGRN